MKIQLPESIVSEQDVAAAASEIKAYNSWLAQATIKQRVAGHKTGQLPAPTLSPAVNNLVNQWRGDQPLTSEGLAELATWLEEFAEDAPSITFTLAAVPTGKLKTTLISWCRQQLNPNILVNFKFNSNLLGGLVVNYGSRIYDWSFRRQILAAGPHFVEVLRRV